MNRECPPCGHDFMEDGWPDGGVVPYEGNTADGSISLVFCSTDCRAEYKRDRGGYEAMRGGALLWEWTCPGCGETQLREPPVEGRTIACTECSYSTTVESVE